MIWGDGLNNVQRSQHVTTRSTACSMQVLNCACRVVQGFWRASNRRVLFTEGADAGSARGRCRGKFSGKRPLLASVKTCNFCALLIGSRLAYISERCQESEKNGVRTGGGLI